MITVKIACLENLTSKVIPQCANDKIKLTPKVRTLSRESGSTTPAGSGRLPGLRSVEHSVQSGPLSLVDECRGSALIGRELP